MRVLHVCAEMFPLLKTGGLADVLGALPSAQIKAGADARLLLPGFPAFKAGIKEQVLVAQLDTFAGQLSLYYGLYQGVGIYLIDAPHLYQREGSPYHDDQHLAYADNHLRFALLGWIASEMACGLDGYWVPDLVHAHDWHAGLACAYLAAKGRPARSVFTVHNLAYQGLFDAKHLDEIGLPMHLFHMHGIEFYGQISFLKAGLFYADHVTTVSPTYAEEITRAEYGYGMELLLQQRWQQGKLSGILNGVDERVWDPATDVHTVSHYSSELIKPKSMNKAYLQGLMKLNVKSKALLFAVVSRLSEQKGLDLVLKALPTIVENGGQLAILGSGNPQLEAQFLALAAEYPGVVGVQIGYSEQLSHCIMGGADVIMVPSRFEPCGLTQLYGLKYGALPLVRKTGGLADTVVDCALENLRDHTATGFVFHDCNIRELNSAIRRAFALWAKPKTWFDVQCHAMKQNFSWHVAATAYLSLYQSLLKRF